MPCWGLIGILTSTDLSGVCMFNSEIRLAVLHLRVMVGSPYVSGAPEAARGAGELQGGPLRDEGKRPNRDPPPHHGPVLCRGQSVAQRPIGPDAVALRRFFATWLASSFLYALSLGCILTVPTFVQGVLNWLEDSPLDKPFMNSGVGLAFCLFALNLGGTLFGRTSEQLTRRIMINVKTLLISAIYQKSLKLSAKASMEFDNGRILNMINVDTNLIGRTIQSSNAAWGAPVQIAVSLILLVKFVGVGTWAGFGFVILAFAIQGIFLPLAVKAQRVVMIGGDRRLKAVRELFQGIRIVKLRAWEDFILKKLTALREHQVRGLKSYYLAIAVFLSLTQLTPVIMPILSFVVYSKKGDFQVSNIFAALVVFGQLFQPMLNLPSSISNTIRGIISFTRIAAFFAAEEMDPIAIAPEQVLSATSESSPSAISIRDASFSWPTPFAARPAPAKKNTRVPEMATKVDGKDSTLGVKVSVEPKIDTADDVLFSDLNLSIKKGSLTAIVGTVGAGKSSLIAALTGGMTQLAGKVTITGYLALCEQQPWILTDTVQANILFGRPLDQHRLEATVHSCCLAEDIERMPGGLATEIGEKGINLSGGQRARIAIARAAYDAAEIVLLDDPLAALDAHVGKRVFDDCIKTALKDRTVVLITHQLHLLNDVD
ncbi:hypothetical protein BDK51DRAFT_39640, partial [Blyttiomyces helicus]